MLKQITQTLVLPASMFNMPEGQVSATAKLNYIIFDLLTRPTTETMHPLAKQMHQNWLHNFAERLNKSTIKLLKNELDQLFDILNDENKWQDVKINIEIEPPNQMVEINSNGLLLFSDIMDALTNLFLGDKNDI